MSPAYPELAVDKIEAEGTRLVYLANDKIVVMAMTQLQVGLSDRVEIVRAKAATPAYVSEVAPADVDIEAWNHVGDPLAENLLTYMRDRKLMGGDTLATARELRAAGVEEAEAFFADVEWIPDWLDFDAMRPGADMGLRYPLALMLSVHGALPFTYVDPATARVMASTGRLSRAGTDFRRRFWESAAGFIGGLDVEGMKPGGSRWEQWVRIRLLHSSIRMGILRSGRWDLTSSMPISQLPTSAGAHIFGRYRVNIIRYVGGRVSEEEAESYNMMWRWVARIEGANTELLGRDSAEQFQLTCRSGGFLYAPNEDSRMATAAIIDGLAAMRRIFLVSRRTHAGMMRALLAPDMVELFPGHDVAADLGLPADPRTDRAAARIRRVDRGITKVLAALPSDPDKDRKIFDEVLNRGLRRQPATFRPTPVAGDHG